MRLAHLLFAQWPARILQTWRLHSAPFSLSFTWVLAAALVAALMSPTLKNGPLDEMLALNLVLTGLVAFFDTQRTRSLGHAMDLAAYVDRVTDAGSEALPIILDWTVFSFPLGVVLVLARVAGLLLQLVALVDGIQGDAPILRALMVCSLVTALLNLWTEGAWMWAIRAEREPEFLTAVAGLKPRITFTRGAHKGTAAVERCLFDLQPAAARTIAISGGDDDGDDNELILA
jgi:hypothetical protein